MELNFIIVKYLNREFKVKPTETILDAKNNFFHEIKNIYKDLSNNEEICFIFQNRILGDDERLDKLDIKPDVFLFIAIIDDERAEKKSLGKSEIQFNDWNGCVDDDGNINWMIRDSYLKKLREDQKIQVFLKIMGEKELNVKNCDYPVLVGREEPIRIASVILEQQSLISAEYHKLIGYGTLLDPNKTFQDYKLQNGDEICVYKDSPRGAFEFFEIWLTPSKKAFKPFEISQCLPLSEVINEKCLNIKTNFFWRSKQLSLDMDESYGAGISVIDIYFDESQRFLTAMGLSGLGDCYRDYMNNVDWTKREQHIKKLPSEKKIELILKDHREDLLYSLIVDPQENMDIALKYHQNKFRISSHCSLTKDGAPLDCQKTFEDGGIKKGDTIIVFMELNACKAAFSSSIMIIPHNKNYEPFSVSAAFPLYDVMDLLCQVYKVSPGTFILCENDSQDGCIKDQSEYTQVKYDHSAMTSRRYSVERVMKIHLFESSNKDCVYEGNRLGRGGFGSVYLYQEKNCRRKLARKIIVNDGHRHTKSFEMETNAFVKLGHHPQIVRFICHTKADNALSIFMELMPGGSLRSYLTENGNKPLRESEIVNYAQQILKALKFLHDNRIIHRDIKGENILLDGKGKAKLADFGQCRVLKDIETGIITEPYGSFRWMAPERMFDGLYDTKVDIWSFGATMIEMVTGGIPYPLLSDKECYLLIRKNKRIDFNYQEQNSDYVKSFISSCLQPNVMSRPTAAELLLHGFLSSISFTGFPYKFPTLPWN